MPLNYGEAAISPPDLRQLLSQPKCPIPLQFLKGKPVFWDDFEGHIPGMINADNGQLATGIIHFGTSRNSWTFADGNEYSCYITSEASQSGKHSLRLGGNQTIYNNDATHAGTQDCSTICAVPSGIIGVEMSMMFANNVGGNPGSLVSIENINNVSTVAHWHEMWAKVHNLGPDIAVYGPGQVSNIVLSKTTADTNGKKFVQNALAGSYSTGLKATSAWHRFALVVDIINGKYLDVYLDSYYVNLRTFFGSATSNWATDATIAATALTEMDGLTRLELHAVAGSADPIIYYDDVVITDESGFVQT